MKKLTLLINNIVPKKNLITFNSFPDLSGNALSTISGEDSNKKSCSEIY